MKVCIGFIASVLSSLSVAVHGKHSVRSYAKTNNPEGGDSHLEQKVAADKLRRKLMGGKKSPGKKSPGKKSSSGKKGSGLGFDPQEWEAFDSMAKDFDADYVGDYETIDTSEISEMFSGEGAVHIIDLGSSSSLFRRRGAAITLSEIRAIWYEFAPIVGEYDGIVLKSVADSLLMYFETVSGGLMATRAMYLALVQRWKNKVYLACETRHPPAPKWCGDIEEERKRFFNTLSAGGAYGDLLLIGEDEKYIEAFGNPVNNAYFAGEEEAEHGEFIIDEDALQKLLVEAGGSTQDSPCKADTVAWEVGVFGIDRFIKKEYSFFCYFTVCFDKECKIPDDE